MADASRAISLYPFRMRVARLAPSGAPLVGQDNLYVTESFVRVDYELQFSETDAVQKPNGRGDLCLNIPARRKLIGVNLTVEICDDDPMLAEMLGGGSVLTEGAGADVVGYQLPKGDAPEGDGVSIEVWTEAWSGSSKVADRPFMWYPFPRCKLQHGSRSLSAEPDEKLFDGTGSENPGWSSGPAGDWAHDSGAAMQWVRTGVEPPAVTNGYAPIVAPSNP